MSTRSKLRDRIRETTSDAILAAAEEVFARSGLHAAKVDDIASQAGVSVGTLYNYFPDRDGLLQSLMATRRCELFDHLDEMLAGDADQPFVVQLEEFLKAIFVHFDAHHAFFKIAFQGETSLSSKGVEKESMAKLYERAEAVVRRGIARNELRPDLVDFYPALLMGLARGTMVHQTFQAGGTLAGRAGEIARFFMEGAGVRHG